MFEDKYAKNKKHCKVRYQCEYRSAAHAYMT